MKPNTSPSQIGASSGNIKSTADRQTLLYIEDNSTNRDLVRHILDPRNLNYIEATNGRQGLEMGKLHHPDLILLDIYLPDMDGFTVFKHLQNDPDTADIPVVAVTGSIAPTDIRQGSEAGFAKFLHKPLDIKEFNITLDTILNG